MMEYRTPTGLEFNEQLRILRAPAHAGGLFLVRRAMVIPVVWFGAIFDNAYSSMSVVLEIVLWLLRSMILERFGTGRIGKGEILISSDPSVLTKYTSCMALPPTIHPNTVHSRPVGLFLVNHICMRR